MIFFLLPGVQGAVALLNTVTAFLALQGISTSIGNFNNDRKIREIEVKQGLQQNQIDSNERLISFYNNLYTIKFDNLNKTVSDLKFEFDIFKTSQNIANLAFDQQFNLQEELIRNNNNLLSNRLNIIYERLNNRVENQVTELEIFKNLTASDVGELFAKDTFQENLITQNVNTINALNSQINSLNSQITNLTTTANNHFNNNNIHGANKVTDLTEIKTLISTTQTNLNNEINQNENKLDQVILYLQNLPGQVSTNIQQIPQQTANLVTTSSPVSPASLYQLKTDITSAISTRINTNKELIEKQIEDDKKSFADLGLQLGVIAGSTTALKTDLTPNNLQNFAKTGACQALNSGCGQGQNANTINNALNPLGTKLDALNTALSGADLAQNTVKLNEINNKLGAQLPNGGIAGKLTRGFKGLYDALGVDRILNMMNTAVLLHNAMMLSNNLGQTLTYAVDNILTFTGFQFTNEEGQQVTASQVLGGTIRDFIINIVGEDAYANARVTLNKANRIYQAASNVAYTVISFVDVVKELSELIVENTGKIGNALRKSGAVLENSYNVMPERATVQTAMQSKIQSLSDNLRDVQEGVETFTEITELAVEGQENIKELRESTTAFQLSLEEQREQIEQERNQLKEQARSNTTISEINFVKAPPEEN